MPGGVASAFFLLVSAAALDRTGVGDIAKLGEEAGAGSKAKSGEKVGAGVRQDKGPAPVRGQVIVCTSFFSG